MSEMDEQIDMAMCSLTHQLEALRLRNLCQILLAFNRLDYGEDYLNYELFFLQSFPERWDEDLARQGVQQDDYDYAILCDRKYLRASDGELYGPPFLNGSCENRWYEVVLDGREWALGVAYHG